MRRKVVAGYARGEETRARILDTAIHLFGNFGFDSVSTRDIAAMAAVPPASLRYYFVNKEGLYVACLNHVQSMTFEILKTELDKAEALLAEPDTSPDQLIDCFCTLQDARIDSLMAGPDNGAAALFTIRHDLPSTGGAGSLGSVSENAQRMAACYIRIMMRISGDTLDTQSALIVTGMIAGLVTNILLRRNRLARMGWEVTPERLDWLKATVRKQTVAVMKSYQT